MKIKLKRLLETKVTDGPHETPELLDEGIPFLSAESVKDGILDFDFKRGYISQEDHNKFKRKAYPQEKDIFIVKSGATTGKVAYLNEFSEEFSIWSPLALVRANPDKIDSKYLYYYIISSLFQDQIKTMWNYGTQQNIGMQVLENLYIIVPKLDVQKQVVLYLEEKYSGIKKVINEKEKLINLLEEKRKAVITEAVTKGLNPNVPMKDSGVEWIGEIPSNWIKTKISYLFREIGSGGTPSTNNEEYYINGTIPWINTGDLNDGYLSEVKKNITEKALQDFSTLKGYTENSLIVAMYGATIGKLAITKIKAVTNQACCVLANPNNTSVRYMYYWFLANRTNIIQLASGGGQPNISQGIIRSLPVYISENKSEQNKIASYLDEMSDEIEKTIVIIKEQIYKLKELRESLIYEAVTGKIDLRDYKGGEYDGD